MLELPIPSYDQTALVRSVAVEIHAPARVVWQVLTDLENYGQWNPLCVSARSTLEIGSPVEMMLTDYSGEAEAYPYIEYVCAIVPERLLSWELRATEICADAARRDQIIEHVAENRCLYYSTDAFLGVDARKIMDEHGDWVKRAFDETAIALKERSERIYVDHKHRNRLSGAPWGAQFAQGS